MEPELRGCWGAPKGRAPSCATARPSERQKSDMPAKYISLRHRGYDVVASTTHPGLRCAGASRICVRRPYALYHCSRPSADPCAAPPPGCGDSTKSARRSLHARASCSKEAGGPGAASVGGKRARARLQRRRHSRAAQRAKGAWPWDAGLLLRRRRGAMSVAWRLGAAQAPGGLSRFASRLHA